MPNCGSQVTICDVPIRFDTYEGCTHDCKYCFVQAKNSNLTHINPKESAKSLLKFIQGARTKETNWCDWNIPLHWGGMSDPFQPVERIYKRSLECLKVFAKTQYPFIVSTKGKLVLSEEYLSLIAQCNVVLQISAACKSYDVIEKGAASFEERMKIVQAVSARGKRVIIRVQPYIAEKFHEIFDNIKLFKQVGAYGIVIEAMKYKTKKTNLVKVAGDYSYDCELLKRHYLLIKQECHRVGLRFFCGENRLRSLGDNLCCCGIENLEGFIPNTFNFNHIRFDTNNVVITDAMRQPGTTGAFGSLHQTSEFNTAIRDKSFVHLMTYEFKMKGKEHIG